MKPRLPRTLGNWWKKIFFWRHTQEHSQEFKPEPHQDHALVFSLTHSTRPSFWKQFRLIHHIFSAKEWRLFIISIVIFSIALLTGLGDLIKPHLISVPTNGGTMSEAVIGSPKLINPLFAPLNDVDRDLTSLIYAGLFRLDDRLEPQPDLVDHYKWLTDQKTLEVTLRKDARFHDDEPVTADDVVFTYQTVQDPTWHSPLASQYRFLKVIRIDDQTVQFQMDKMRPDVFMSLTLGILPAHIWADVAGTNASLAEANLRPIGAGPYAVTSFTRDSKGTLLSYTLKRFAEYHGTKPYIDEMIFHFYGDRTQALTALRNHQVDAFAFVPWNDVAALKNTNIQSINLNLPQETIAFFNIKDSLLSNNKIRQALTLAIDTRELQDAIGSHASLVSTPFPFFEGTVSSTIPNLETARGLLDAAGWKLADGETVRTLAPKTKTASSTPLTLTIDAPNDQSDLAQVADYLKHRWSLLGAQVVVRISDPDTLLRTSLEDRKYQILIWNILLSANQDISPFWASKNSADHGLNLSNLADRSVDSALDNLSTTTSTQAAAKAQQAVAQSILDQYPALFLVRSSYAYLVAGNIKGIHDMRIAQPAARLLNTADWYVSTGWRWK